VRDRNGPLAVLFNDFAICSFSAVGRYAGPRLIESNSEKQSTLSLVYCPDIKSLHQ
jgi:hypothetical protein